LVFLLTSFVLTFPPMTHMHSSCLHSCYMPCISHPPRLHHSNYIVLGEEYKSRSSSLCSFLHHPVTSSLFGPNILLSTLFSDTLSLRSSLNVRQNYSIVYSDFYVFRQQRR
jgi:hypothetical protein